MATVKRFEDLDVWRKTRVLVKEIYDVTAEGSFARDFTLRDQIRRAAISIMLNIAEGFARKSDKEFSHYLNQSHGSAAELQSGLYIALDQDYIQKGQFTSLYSLTGEVSKMLMAFSRYLQGRS